MQLDHLFICFDDASVAERELADFGLTFGTRSFHPGQGTANCCAYFENAYLELMWPHRDDELQSGIVRPLALYERVHWRYTNASPFGVAFRAGADSDAVRTWHYDAPFLPPGMGFPIVTPPLTPDEPLIFLIPRSQPLRPTAPTEHRGKRRTVTGIRISGPRVSVSPFGASQPSNLDVFAVAHGGQHLLELEWNHQSENEVRDFRPALPLVIRW